MIPSPPAHDAPCPCGSGRPYQHCCRPGRAGAAPGSETGTGALFEELRRALAGRDFASMDEVQDFANALMERRNRAGLDDFHGLSPEQMYRLLHFPFDSPQLVTFPEHLAGTPEAPMLTLFLLLTDAMSERGLKCTAKGNLPRAFCREAAEALLGAEGYRRATEFRSINTEPDFSELHVTRLVAGDAGLIRKHQGRFKLTRECCRLLGEGGPRAVYPRLFRTYVQRFNWAYTDGYPELPFIQQSFLFTLYLLRRYGAEERPHTFYEDAYLRAFPVLLEQIPPSPYASPEREARDCYTLRTLDRFAAFLGLAAVRELSKDILNRDCRITKRPLLEQAVRFRL